MADSPSKQNPIEPVIVTFFVVTILGALIMRFQEFLLGRSGLANFLQTFWLFLQGETSFANLVGATGSPFIATALFVLRIASLAFSIFLIWKIVSTQKKFKEAEAKLKAGLKPPKEIVYGVETPAFVANPKWVKVLEHVNSEHPSDWKLAILEADIMLNDMLEKMGYAGATMSDKLKSVEPSDFDTLQDAWEAHKIRNSIAHEGSDYVVNKPEAERVIRLFKKVFEEFEYI